MFRDFFREFIKIHILHHAAEEPIYGLAMMEELQLHGYEISAGTIYPILRGMEEEGWLAREERVVSGRIRTYYRATDSGRAALEDVKVKIRVLVEEVLEGHGPQHSAKPGRCGQRRRCQGSNAIRGAGGGAERAHTVLRLRAAIGGDLEQKAGRLTRGWVR